MGSQVRYGPKLLTTTSKRQLGRNWTVQDKFPLLSGILAHTGRALGLYNVFSLPEWRGGVVTGVRLETGE